MKFIGYAHAGLLLVMLLAGAWLAGCVHAPLNQPLEKYESNRGYRYTPGAPNAASSDLAILLFFSGGGKRAAALSYGVLKELAATTVPIEGGNRRLLDEVEVISSVSGGSFTAAYYCLYHDRIFADFEARFLKRNVNGALLRRIAARWPALVSPYYGRSDLAADYYDRNLFDQATFAELTSAGGRPFLMINATDMANGEQFAFSQIRFDLLSSDLSKFHIARAVAASSAVPLLLTPITIKNYAGTLGVVQSDFLPTSVADASLSYREREVQHLMLSYTDSRERPYIHLMDGGLSDNLGLRSLMDAGLLQGGLRELLVRIRMAPPKKLVLVVVNAATRHGGEWSKREAIPGTFNAIEQMADNIGGRVNHRSLEVLQPMLDDWRRKEIEHTRAQASGSSAGLVPDYYLVTVDFDKMADPPERNFFQNLPTNYDLPDETVDRLVAAAGRLLRESGEYRRLLHDLDQAGHKN
jgi:NTE family protein